MRERVRERGRGASGMDGLWNEAFVLMTAPTPNSPRLLLDNSVVWRCDAIAE